MQTWSGQNPRGAVSATRKVTTTIVLVFSLAGLIAGFAFGGLTGTKAHPTPANTGPVKKPTPVVQATVTPTPTATPADIQLDYPQFKLFPASTESAANGTVYTVGMQAVDKQKKPVNSPDITCKVWLVHQIPAQQTLSIDPKTLGAVNNLTSPIQGTVNGQPAPEITGGLIFDSTTPQEALCNANGQMTWKYTIAPTVTPPGTYDLVILADWKGKHYNWYWTDITIQ